ERATVHVALARLYLRRGDKGVARQQLDKALAAATGEEARESKELAELLVTFGRREDALKLLEVLASEPESSSDPRLLMRTAQLAHELGRNQTAARICARLRSADGGIERCP